jgi:hypothetical protein
MTKLGDTEVSMRRLQLMERILSVRARAKRARLSLDRNGSLCLSLPSKSTQHTV